MHGVVEFVLSILALDTLGIAVFQQVEIKLLDQPGRNILRFLRGGFNSDTLNIHFVLSTILVLSISHKIKDSSCL